MVLTHMVMLTKRMSSMKKLLVSLCALSVLSFASDKIVSVGGSVTETIAALGSQDRLIGVDLSSVYPHSVSKLPKVGYWLKLSKEGILSLKPNMIIASEYSRPKETLEALKGFGIETHLVDDKPTLESAIKKITQIGEVLNKKDEAKKITTRIENNISKIKKEIKAKNKKVLFLFYRGGDKLMAAGVGTHINELIVQSGAKNVATFRNYRIMSKEAIVKENPDVIIVGDIPHNRFDLNKFKDGSLKITNANKNNAIYNVDMLLVGGFGPRVDEAFKKVACMTNEQALSFCKE